MTTANQTHSEPDELEALIALARHENRAGRLVEAAAAFRRILAIRPDGAEMHGNLGVVLARQNQLDEAIERFERAIALRPNYAEAHNNLGIVRRMQGQLEQAAAHYEQALALRPNYADAHNNLGIVLWQQGKLDQALAHYRQAIALRPDFADAHNNLGALLRDQGRLDQAAAHYRQAIAARPDYAEAHNNLGRLLHDQGKFDEARAHLEQALAIRPDLAEAHTNLGNVLAQQGELDQAVSRYGQAIALKPTSVHAHNNLAITLRDQGKREEAVAHFNQALALRPGFAEAELGLATCYLVEGDYQRGWPAFECRLRMPEWAPRTSLPRWSGEPLAGRSLLLLAEQGLGDTVQFIRYARLLRERGARVVLAAPAALGRLLTSYADVDELFILGSAELPACDFYLPLLSAPYALGTTRATIPGGVPYLSADAALTDHWRQKLAAVDGFRIGIVWQGARGYRLDRWRSIPLAEFAPLARLPGVRLISLQKGFGSEQIAAAGFPVLDLAGRLDEAAGAFMDTAAVMRNLDLIVTPDTAVAHVAGALGLPVWVALPLAPDWRWLLDCDDSPWYPTLRLFRQTRLGQWQDVFERIAKAIAARRWETTSSRLEENSCKSN